MPLVNRVLSAVAVAAVAAAPAFAQTERSVYATVLDKSGAPATSLTAKDFVVREDGIQREVLRAVRADEPMQIAVLVDTSQAVERYVNDLRRAVTRFVREMAPEHELALIGFGERSTLITDFTHDVARLEAGIGRLFARQGSGAYALDAIIDAAKSLRMREGARREIVVISTEGPEFSERYYQTVLDEVRNAATLHSFILTRSGRSVPLDEARRQRELTFAEGASETGGRREHLLTSLALDDRLHGLAVELKNQYRVDYSRPATLVPPEKIDVDVRQAGLTVRAPRVPPAVRTSS